MRRARLFWRGELIGTIPVPDSYRPPIAQAFLDLIPSMLIGRSRSWLYDVREGDLRLRLRGEASDEEVIVVATPRLGPGDIGCLVGFEAVAGEGSFGPDEGMLDLAAQVLREATGR